MNKPQSWVSWNNTLVWKTMMSPDNHKVKTTRQMHYHWSKYKELQWPGAPKVGSPKTISSGQGPRKWVGVKRAYVWSVTESCTGRKEHPRQSIITDTKAWSQGSVRDAALVGASLHVFVVFFFLVFCQPRLPMLQEAKKQQILKIINMIYLYLVFRHL